MERAGADCSLKKKAQLLLPREFLLVGPYFLFLFLWRFFFFSTSEQLCRHRGSPSRAGRSWSGSGEAAATPPGKDTTAGRTLTTTWDVGYVLLHANYVLNGVFLINEVKERSFQHLPAH